MSRKQVGEDELDAAVVYNRTKHHKWLASVVACTMTLDSWTDKCTKQTWTAIILCSQGREFVVELLPNSMADGTSGHDTGTSKMLMKRGLSAIASVIAVSQKKDESQAVELVRQITSDDAPGYKKARKELVDESNGLIVENHCLLHAVQNTFKAIFQVPILQSLLQKVIAVITTCRKPSVFERYEGHRKRHNKDVLRARKLREVSREASELLALPGPDTSTAPRLNLPAETRFGTNFVALQNLLSNLPVLRHLDHMDVNTSLHEVDIALMKRIVHGLCPLYRLIRLGDSTKSGGVSKAHSAFQQLRDNLRSTLKDDTLVPIIDIVKDR